MQLVVVHLRPALITTALCAVLASAPAMAQELDVVVPAEDGARDAAWTERFATALEAGGRTTRSDVDAIVIGETVRQGATAASRVDGLAEVAALLGDARAEAASLHEGRALAKLARALQLAEAHPDVAGDAAWCAEVQTAIGIVAAQAGLMELSQGALMHAATLDATRGVRAAEAPPDIVARAADIARRVATGPTGTFTVETDVPGARVLLDDVDVGIAPREVRASVGRHVLRVEAPGRRTYGTMLDVFEGEAPPLRVTLDEDPWLANGRALVRAARAHDAPAVRAALATLRQDGVHVFAVWTVEASEDGTRAAIARCDAERCGFAWGVPADELPRRVAGERDLARADLPRGDEAFLQDGWHRPHRPTEPTIWDGPWPWIIGSAVVLIGGAILIGLAVQPPPGPSRGIQLGGHLVP